MVTLMANKNDKCLECGGTGSYLVFNAYDPEDTSEVACEYCAPKKEVIDKLLLN